jgi:O-antigen/teichoic acid export membrane protein
MEKRQTLATMVIRVCGLIFGAVATAIIARLLQPEKFGEYAFVLAVVTVLSMPLAFGLRQTLVREISYARAHAGTGHSVQIWAWALHRAIWATGVFAVALAVWIAWGINDPALQWHMALGLGIYLLLPAPKLLSGVLHGMGHTVQSQLPEHVLRPLLTITVLAVVWITGEAPSLSVSAALLIFALTLLADAALSLVLLKRGSDFRFWPQRRGQSKITQGRALTISTLSFGAIASVQLINNNLDIVMLGILSTDAQVGLYKSATVLSTITVFGLGAVNTVIMPQIAKMHAEGNSTQLQTMITKAARIITAFGIGGALIIWAFGGALLTVIFDDSFGGAYWALVILTLGQLANACFGPVALVLNMTGHQKLTLIGVSAAVLVNATLNLALVPRYGMEGAAIATAVSLVVWNALLAVALKWRTGYSSSIL